MEDKMVENRGPAGAPARECFSHERDQKNREKGVAHGRSQFCAFFHADDYLAPANGSGVVPGPVEPFFTLKEAAEYQNIKYWLLLRMAKRGDLPTYMAGNTRKRVLLSEVVATIRQSAEGDQ
jgi:excisionase family DNA binding protein